MFALRASEVAFGSDAHCNRGEQYHYAQYNFTFAKPKLHKNLKVLDFQGRFHIYAQKQHSFTVAPFLDPFGLERAIL